MRTDVQRRFVFGQIRDANRTPVCGVEVEVVDRDLRSLDLVGCVTTNRRGEYVVDYTDYDFVRAEKDAADIIVRVRVGKGEVLAESKTHYNAPAELRVDLVLGRGAGEPEFDRYVATLRPLLSKIPLSALEDDDIEFLTHETGIGRRRLGMLARAAGYHEQTQLAAFIFYGMFRRGIPLQLQSLVATPNAQKRLALKQAVGHHIIGPLDVDEALQRLAKAAVAVDNPTPSASVLTVAAASGLGATARTELVDFAMGTRMGRPDFWERLADRTSLGPADVAAVRFSWEARGVTGGDVELTRTLQEARRHGQWASAEDLGKLRLEDWARMLSTSGLDPDDAREYLELARVRFPGATLRHALLDERVPASDAARAFVAQHPQFDPTRSPITDVPAGPVRDDLSRVRRLSNVTAASDRPEMVAALSGLGYGAAREITAKHPATFAAQVSNAIGQPQARAIWSRAAARRDATEDTAVQVAEYLGERIAFIPVGPSESTSAPIPGDTPDWSELFGRRAACRCEHCRSLLSPAAYFVDLMNMLGGLPLQDGRDARSALLEKRPDLQYLRLDCRNATTPLPYLDLVLERLEDLAAGRHPQMPPPPASADADWDVFVHEFQTHTDDAAQLRAVAEHETRPDATEPYRVERWGAWRQITEASTPWMLPFDPFARKAQLLAKHLGVSLSELRASFGAPPASIARAALGLETTWRLVTSRVDPAEVWGAGFAALGEVGGVGPFIERARLSMPQLEQLLETAYLDGTVVLDRDAEDPCDLERARLVGLRERLDHVHRFLRLRHALELELPALDDLLAALGASQIDAEVLIALAEARRLGERLGTDPAAVARAHPRALAELMRRTPEELDELVAVTANDPFAAGASTRARLGAIADLVDDAGLLERFDLSAAELRYLLQGIDRPGGVFAPSADELEAFARLAYGAVSGADDPTFALAEALAPILSVEAGTALELGTALSHPADAGRTTFDALIDLDAPSFGDAPATVREFASNAARGLLSVARIVDALGLSAARVRSWLGAPGPGLLDPRALVPGRTPPPFADFRELARLATMAPPRDDVFELVRAARAGGATAEAQISAVADATGWSLDDIVRPLHAGLGLTLTDYQGATAYARLSQAVALLRRWSTTPESLAVWADPAPAGYFHLAASLEAVAEARHADPRQWLQVLTPIQDQLREDKRDALLAWLTRDGARTVADLYGELLLDAEISSCALTSRIKQANAAIQLFAQRLRMNLEDSKLHAEADFEAWDWMRYYRLWEANRKVFLFPENWIEPELRDDESPLFRELRSALLQDDPTSEVVEAALRTYVDGFDDVARLQVRGLFESDDDLHLVARTYIEPREYFYRRRSIELGIWTPWERLDFGIRGDHAFPVVVDGRLFIIWAETRREVVGEQKVNSLELKWVERRGRGWSGVRTGGGINRGDGYDWDQIDIHVEVDDGVRIAFYGPVPEVTDDAPPLMWSVAAVVLDPCTNEFRPDVTDEAKLASIPPRTVTSGLSLLEEPGDEGQLFVLGINPNEPTFSRELDLDELKRRYKGITFICGVIIEGLAEAGRMLEASAAYEAGRTQDVVLERTPGEFRVVPEVSEREFTGRRAFALDIEGRSYISWPDRTKTAAAWPTFSFETFFHPHGCAIYEASVRGAKALLTRDFDERPDTTFDFATRYAPNANLVRGPFPTLDLQFGLSDAYGSYNWELFFHIPVLVAARLSATGRFEEAQRWLHYIFDPTRATASGGAADSWRFPPFHELASHPPETLDELLRRIAAGEEAAQLEVMRRDPFNPHAIARLRRVAYMKGVVLAYLRNLIAWGDSLFARDTIETLNEATQLYVLAAEILGSAPPALASEPGRDLTWREAADGVSDPLSNIWLELETRLPATTDAPTGAPAFPQWLPYFCVPRNDQLAALRDTIADRLFKVRNCENLEGIHRQLPLFEPPIDPALLVRVRAAGLSLAQVLSAGGRAGLSAYRFSALHQRATQAAGEVRTLGAALLSALEKKDAERLSRLRTRHESAVLDLSRSVVEARIDEAEENLAQLRVSRANALSRQRYYESRKTNASEKAHVELTKEARNWDIAAQSLNLAASIAHLVPDFTASASPGATFGGSNIGSALKAVGSLLAFVSSQYTAEANMASIAGSRQHRADDWAFQAQQAETDGEGLESQIAAAQIRLAIAREELRNHDARIAHNEEVEAFLRDKFTNEELYGWMASRLAALHHETYRLAVDLARQAERAAANELGVENLRVIGFEHFDSGRRGLLAGEHLTAELQRLQERFVARNVREFELTKHVSLATLAPLELLRLRETGSGTFTIPEILFDLDFPGQIRRRIRSVSVSIPCVAGPYSTVNATLRLDQSQVRWGEDDETLSPMAAFDGPSVIATSTGQNDAGVFELSFRDERLLPFEGAGAISQWTLEIPHDIPSFDHDSISDVILHVRYTAADSGRDRSGDHLRAQLRRWLDDGERRAPMRRIFSLRREFSADLHRFLHPPDGGPHEVVLPIESRHFATFLRGFDLRLPPDADEVPVQARVWIQAPGGVVAGVELGVTHGTTTVSAEIAESDIFPRAEFAGFSGDATGDWSLRIARGDLVPEEIEDIWLELAFRPHPTTS